MKCRFWLPNRPQENAKAVNQGTSGIQLLSSPSNPDPDAQQTILSVFKSVLSMQNMGCYSFAEQLMAAGATDEEVKKISQIMAQTVRKLEGGSNSPEPRIEVLKPACEVVVLDAVLPSCIPGCSSMDIEGQEAIKRSLSNAATEKRRLAKKCKQEEDVLYSLIYLWFWIRFIAVPFYLTLSRVGEAENPGPVCATAKLFGAKYDAIGQWAQNLSNRSEVELEPLFAQVGECRQMFSERFGKDSKLYTSSVSQDIHSTHSHLNRSSLSVSP